MNDISLAFWYKNYRSPVIFMIDDLANIYFNSFQRELWNSGDWGGMLDKDGSMYSYLEKNIIANHPNIKFTFFLVTGHREIQSSGSYDHVDDASDPNFIDFLESLQCKGHEIAYHGNSHGVIDDDNLFIQEWDSYQSLEQACKKIDEGLRYINASSLLKINGGKYCGYRAGKYGHDSILRSDFSWWFDHWDTDVSIRPYGNVKDTVFYFPSNIDCSIYSWKLFKYLGNIKYYRSVIKQIMHGTVESKLSYLLSKRGIISLQEHSSPIRTDGKIQYPNVFSDIHSIHYILDFLEKKNVWWATASEVHDYTLIKESIEILSKSENSFSLISKNKALDGRVITLTVPSYVKEICYGRHRSAVYNSGGEQCVDLAIYSELIYTVI